MKCPSSGVCITDLQRNTSMPGFRQSAGKLLWSNGSIRTTVGYIVQKVISTKPARTHSGKLPQSRWTTFDRYPRKGFCSETWQRIDWATNMPTPQKDWRSDSVSSLVISGANPSSMCVFLILRVHRQSSGRRIWSPRPGKGKVSWWGWCCFLDHGISGFQSYHRHRCKGIVKSRLAKNPESGV